MKRNQASPIDGPATGNSRLSLIGPQGSISTQLLLEMAVTIRGEGLIFTMPSDYLTQLLIEITISRRGARHV